MSVQYDDRRFRLIFRTLGISGRMKVGTLALLGRRASDPETAWLVYMFSLRQLRLRWLRLLLGFTLLAVSAWLFAQTHSLHLLLVLQFSVGIVFLASLWMHSRAVRLNEPIARAPGTSDAGRGHQAR
jgi:uncharacterized membrane protein affecting hemolysin expression